MNFDLTNLKLIEGKLKITESSIFAFNLMADELKSDDQLLYERITVSIFVQTCA